MLFTQQSVTSQGLRLLLYVQLQLVVIPRGRGSLLWAVVGSMKLKVALKSHLSLNYKQQQQQHWKHAWEHPHLKESVVYKFKLPQ